MRPFSNRKLLPVWIGFSLGLHSLFFVLPNLQPHLDREIRDLKEKAIEVMSPKDLDVFRKPVVQTSQIKEGIKSQEKADYAGEFDQRVEQQTQSPITGAFREGKGISPEENIDIEGKGGESPSQRVLALREFMDFGRSPHALSKDIPFGNQTILNTDKVRYASFVNRIADEIYHPWVEAAERVARDYLTGRRKIEANLYITRLRITLDEEGAIQGIQVLDSSGILELDEAPKKAFWEMEPFPNPPDQLVENDGFVRLTYEFQFEWKNSVFNIIPWKI